MLVVWRFYDGKPGHDRQGIGLAQALAIATPLETHAFDVRDNPPSAWGYVSGRAYRGEGAPDPDFILGAGRRCQWPMLAARRARGGLAIYLMKPQLPRRCFDLCLIPRHDIKHDDPTVIVTDGVLNDIVAATARGCEGLILIGGPSDHYAWDGSALLRQIQSIVAQAPSKRWVVADSRRTPSETVATMRDVLGDKVSWMPHGESVPGWLPAQLARSNVVWVSSDSVSMIYEALTAGAAVGLLEIPARRDGRITRIAHDLADRKLVTPYRDWCAGAGLEARTPLAEARRCADLILARWDPVKRSFKDTRWG